MHYILFIDDNKVEHSLIEEEIKEEKLKIKPVFKLSGEEALEYLKNCKEGGDALPEMIVVDLHMGGLSGDEFMDAFQQAFGNKANKVKVFYLSNSFMLPEADEYEQYPFVKGAFEKPFSREIFEEMLEA
jgi:CheY-like chemotaxis protein